MRALSSALLFAAFLTACSDEALDAASAGAGGDGHTHTHSHDAAAALEQDANVPGASLDAGDDATTFDWDLPPGFPVPKVPADNPVTPEKVELGRRLFYDERLSGNGQQSCGSCHEQARAFTDGRAHAVGSTGQVHPRSAMGLGNVAYASSFTWANPTLASLEDQALVPLFGDDPVELGLSGSLEAALEALQEDESYVALFAGAFPEEQGAVSLETITKAIATFQRALISGRAPYDRFVHDGEAAALSASAQRGLGLFFSERLECFHCHGGFNFSGAVTHVGKAFDENTFHNNGLYNLDSDGAYPPDNTGLFASTGVPEDMGRFKAPTLRNIEKTAPYMHDGSIATLVEVIDHYAAGGRNVEQGPYAGDGRRSPLRSDMVPGFAITEQEKADVIAFLESLTDEGFLTDARFSDPERP
jgi:cytochrome c peroxidase